MVKSSSSTDPNLVLLPNTPTSFRRRLKRLSSLVRWLIWRISTHPRSLKKIPSQFSWWPPTERENQLITQSSFLSGWAAKREPKNWVNSVSPSLVSETPNTNILMQWDVRQVLFLNNLEEKKFIGTEKVMITLHWKMISMNGNHSFLRHLSPSTLEYWRTNNSWIRNLNS